MAETSKRPAVSEGEITVGFFGVARSAAGRRELVLQADGSLTLAELRQMIAGRLGAEMAAVLEVSRFAAGEDILDPSAIIEPGWSVVVLPPVSGG